MIYTDIIFWIFGLRQRCNENLEAQPGFHRTRTCNTTEDTLHLPYLVIIKTSYDRNLSAQSKCRFEIRNKETEYNIILYSL